MHPAAFFHIVRSLIALPPPRRVLEIGSLDVNSSEQGLNVRDLMPGVAYVGVDAQAGPGVDIVADATHYDGKHVFDTVICAEVLEHAPDPVAVIACARRALRPGGALILTCAGPNRAPHNCDGTPWRGVEHYAAIAPDRLAALLDGWQDVTVLDNADAGDVYAVALVPDEADADPALQPARRADERDLALLADERDLLAVVDGANDAMGQRRR